MKSISRVKKSAVLFLAMFISQSTTAWALQPHETFVHYGSPTEAQLAEWSRLPGSRNYLIELDTAPASYLQSIASVRNADKIQVHVTNFPNRTQMDLWKKLAGQGVELISFGIGIPNDDQIQTLNEIGFSHINITLADFLTEDQAKHLLALKCPFSLSYGVNRFPHFDEKAAFQVLASSVSVLYATDYWPRYDQMDVMNMIPQMQKMHITNILPTELEQPYLHGIKNLSEVIVDLDSDPMTAPWHFFHGLNVRWSAKDHVPSPDALRAFAATAQDGGTRKIVIDRDEALTLGERARLESSPFPVEWIHNAN